MRELDEFESNNTKRIVFGLVGLVAVAIGVGLVFRSKGVGVAEEDHRILIVEDRTVNFEHFVADLGFEAISGDFEAWQKELAKQDGSRAAQEFRLADMLEFADEHGYGYVVIETPQRFADEIAALEIDDEQGAVELGESRFAVLSVGDFADPHQIGVEPPASSVELDVGRRLLRSLFVHPRLSQLLDAKAAPSDIQAARLKLDGAIKAYEQIVKHEQRAAEMLGELEAELGGFTSVRDTAHQARVLHEPLAGATAYALSDGRVLVSVDPLRFAIGGSGLELRSSPELTLRAIPAGVSASASAAVACPELDGYSVRRMELSAERDALFVVERGEVGTLHAFDAAAGPCGLRKVDQLALPSSDNSYVAVSRNGIAMRHVDEDHRLYIDAQLLGESAISITVEAPGFDSSSSLAWLDERRLVSLVDLDDRRPALVFVDLDRPDAAAVVPLRPPEAFGQIWAHELARIPGGERALVLRWSSDSGYYLSRLDFDRPWAELIPDAPPPSAEAPSPLADTPPPNITWTPIVGVETHMRGFEIDPSARAVAFTYEGDAGVDVALARLPGKSGEAGSRVVILDDAYEHREVGFRPAHDELLFRTRIRLEKPEGTLLTVHAIDVAKLD